ncbi:MAG: protein arginine kinase [Candidatus Brocadiia bacterium]
MPLRIKKQMKIDSFLSQAGEWIKGNGPDSDVVISSRVRLARNLHGFIFLTMANEKQQSEIEEYIRAKLQPILSKSGTDYFFMKEMNSLDRGLLVERHLISKDMVSGSGARGLFVNSKESQAIMVNEEDHLRLQVLKSGLQIEKAWEELDALDNQVESVLPYAFSPQFGYLTACPTNAGTGMRVSVMLHLPALAMIKQINKVFQALGRIKIMVRGFYGEGTEATGDFYQISNQVTLGKSEKEIASELANIIPEIVKYERGCRDKMLNDSHKRMEDKVYRSYGVLRYARSVSSEEALELFSVIRLGITTGLIKDISLKTINELFILTQPSHLQKMEKKSLNATERDILRAQFIKGKLDK